MALDQRRNLWWMQILPAHEGVGRINWTLGAVNLSQQRYHFACGVRHLIHQRTGSGLAGGGGFEHVINKFDLTL